MNSAQTMLRDLRWKGAVVTLTGERVQVRAPRGAVTPVEREAFGAEKSAVMSALVAERRILQLSLSEFEAQSVAIEARVPWSSDTLWFVPRSEHVTLLVNEGVARTRIWTARVLRIMASLPGDVPGDIERIARFVSGFGMEGLDLLKVDTEPSLELPPRRRFDCPGCGSGRFWRSILGVVVCGVCHPPAHPDVVAEWRDGIPESPRS